MEYKGIIKCLIVFITLFALWYLFGGYFLFVLLWVSVLFMIVTSLLYFITFRQPQLQLETVHDIVTYGDLAYIHIKVIKDSFLMSGTIYCDLIIENSFGHVVERKKMKLTDIMQTEMMFKMHCGYYRVMIHQIMCYDLFHCFYKKCTVDLNTSFYVFPSKKNDDFQMYSFPSNTQECFQYEPYKKGDDYLELFEIREYQTGDSVKNILWKISSKRKNLLVKEGSLPLQSRIQIGIKIIDHDIDETLERFYTLCLMLLKQNISFEIWNESQLEFVEVLDDRHFTEIIKELLVSLSLYSDSHQKSGYLINGYGIEVASHE